MRRTVRGVAPFAHVRSFALIYIVILVFMGTCRGCVRPTGACAPPRVTLHHEAGSVAVESALVLDHDGATTFAKSQRSQQVGIWVV